MKVGVLTSSRADYGIYLSLLQALKVDSSFELEIIAFGSHLSKYHGYTIEDIYNGGYSKIHELSTILTNDDAPAISTSYALTVLKFSDFWANNSYDVVFCLGDRFEMSAAVQAAIPYGVKFAHVHGGETTLGAIDNIYRHQITLASTLHFTVAEPFARKVTSLIESDENVFTVGSLSLDEVRKFKPMPKGEFYDKYNLSEGPYILATFHPETISVNKNKDYALAMRQSLQNAIESLNISVVITMPNTDTMGTLYRQELATLKNEIPSKVQLIENFGKVDYFNAMIYSQLLIGNTSSGIIEAASFGKYVVNVGDRQKGRLQSENILNSSFEVDDIVSNINVGLKHGEFQGKNIYFRENTAKTIINIIKTVYEKL